MNGDSEPSYSAPPGDQAVELERWASLFLSVPESFAREVWPQLDLKRLLSLLEDQRSILRTQVGTPRASFTVSDRKRALTERQALDQWDAATIAAWHDQALPHWQAAQEYGSVIVDLVRRGSLDEAAELLRAQWHGLYLPAGHRVFLRALGTIAASRSGEDALELLAIHRLLLGGLWPPSDDPTVDLPLTALTQDQLAALAPDTRLLVTSAVVLALVGTGKLKAAIDLGEWYLNDAAADWQRIPLAWVPFFFTALAEAYATAGWPGKASHYAARVEELPDLTAFPAFRACALQSVAYALNGEYERSTQYSARARAISREEGWELSGSHLPLMLSDLLVSSARLDEAALSETASLLRRAFPARRAWTTTALVAEAMVHLCRNEVREGVAILRSVLNGTDDWGLLGMVRGFALGINADLLLAAGAAGETLGLLEKARSSLGHALCFDMQRSSAHILLGQPAQVLMCTDACIALGADHCLRTLPPVLIRRAVAYWQLDLPEQADRCFLDAFLLLRQSRSLTPLLNLPRDVTDVLWSRLREQHREYEADIHEILERSTILPARPVVAVSGGGLTARELQFAAILRGGADSRQIARELFLSPNTVKVHLRNLYSKLGAHSRAEALAKIEELGLFPLNDALRNGPPKGG